MNKIDKIIETAWEVARQCFMYDSDDDEVEHAAMRETFKRQLHAKLEAKNRRKNIRKLSSSKVESFAGIR